VLLPLYVAGILGPSIGAGVAALTGVSGVFPAAGIVFGIGGLAIAGILGRLRRRRVG
jgi:hypothetical protein